PRLVVETHDRKIGDDTVHAAGEEPRIVPARSAANEAGAGDEIDLLDEAPLLVLHRDDHLRQACDVVAAAGAGQAGRRIFRIADEGAVEIAVLIDLRAAHASDIDIAAVEQQDIGAAEHHIGAPRAALLVGGGRELARLDEGTDRPTLEEDGKARAME